MGKKRIVDCVNRNVSRNVSRNVTGNFFLCKLSFYIIPRYQQEREPSVWRVNRSLRGSFGSPIDINSH